MRPSPGFSLPELLITLVVIGILAAIALPNYATYIERAQRANARNALIQTAQWMERAATALGRYPALASVPPGLLAVEGGRYTVSIASVDDTSFILIASPVQGSSQASDACGSFVLDQANRRTVRGNAAGMSDADCWSR